MRRGLFVLVMFVGSGRIAVGCSSDGGSAPPASVDSGADGVADVAPDSSLVPVDAADPDPVPPPGLPDGWEIERTYDKHCGIYVPTTKATLPAPIRWEPCPVTATPSGADCRLMAIDDVPGYKDSLAWAEMGSMKTDGSVLLGAYRRVQSDWLYTLIVDADGPVHAAYLLTDPGHCQFATPSIAGDRFAMRILEYSSDYGGGVMASDWVSGPFAPRIAIHLDAESWHLSSAASFAIVDLSGGTFDRYAWTDGARLPSLPASPQDKGHPQGIAVSAGGAAFWSSGNSDYYNVKVYTPAAAVRDLLSAGMVTTRGYGDLGTDGKDLVWIEVAGRTTDTGPFDSYTIMTAPFTTEPAAVLPRRLRTEQGPELGFEQFQVGCGYAARSFGQYIRIVRLSDGQSWILSNALTDPWGWTEPLALTCTELFATVHVSGVTRLARVRLDSLGPGIAPD